MTIVGNYHRYFKLYPYHTRINDFSSSKGENEITYQKKFLIKVYSLLSDYLIHG